MKKIKLIFLIILLLVSCSPLSTQLQSILENSNSNTPSDSVRPELYCPNITSSQALVEDPTFIKSSEFKNSNFNFIEKIVLLSLLELGRRPDTIQPTSRLQTFLKYEGELYYFDFRPSNLDDDSKMSYFYGLQFLLQKFKSTQTLLTLANYIEQSWKNTYKVSPEFEFFLTENKSDIIKNQELSKLYLKGDELISKFETFQRPKLVSLIKNYAAKNIFIHKYYETSKNDLNFNYAKANDNIIKCNFDINRDTFTQDDLFFDGEYSSETIEYAEKNNFFIALSSSFLKKPLETNDSFFLKSRPATSPIPVCKLKNILQNIEIYLASNKGRNPSQHIKHLIDYDVINSQSLNTLDYTINFARHLFLANPDRILYESKHGRKEQLNFFLQMNFPIYHVESLGNIATFSNVLRNNHFSINKDMRSNKQLICNP